MLILSGVSYRIQMKTWIWTKAGLAKLGQIICRSREEAGMNQRAAASFVSKQSGFEVSHQVLSTVERASVRPLYDTLAAIAASGFVKHRGRVLDIFDFIAIASEADVIMTPMRKLVEDHVNNEGITLERFAKICRVAIDDMEAILNGEETEDYEADLILIAGRLTNPVTGRKFRTYLELLDYCGMSKNETTDTWELSHKS